MRNLTAVIFVLAATSSPLAALPPEYQRQAELQAVVSSLDVIDALNGNVVDSIVYVSRDLYKVTGGKCSLEVTIVDLPIEGEPMPGPRQFGLEVGRATCDQ